MPLGNGNNFLNSLKTIDFSLASIIEFDCEYNS